MLASPFDSAQLSASPVSPVLVALAWARAAPEAPLVAVGLEVTLASPPLPPSAAPVATELPPAPGGALDLAGGGGHDVDAEAALAGDGDAHAAGPAVAGLGVDLDVVVGVAAVAGGGDGLGAGARVGEALGQPSRSASPVSPPSSPESPLVASPPTSALLSASPVSPVLVVLAWAIAAPVAPDLASGEEVTSDAPPSPPLASPVATDAPPVAMAEPVDVAADQR